MQACPTSLTAASACSSLSVLAALPMATVAVSSVTTEPSSGSHTLLLEVNTKEPVPSHLSSAALICVGHQDQQSAQEHVSRGAVGTMLVNMRICEYVNGFGNWFLTDARAGHGNGIMMY